MIGSYPSIYALGHKAIAELLDSPVVVEEKVDGSQYSWGVYNGVVECRSKGTQIITDAPDGMFKKAVETVFAIAPLLTPEWTYRGEYLQKPKHNVLKYSRVPIGNIILFDVMTGVESYLTPTEKAAEAARIGLECVPCFFEGKVDDLSIIKAFLDRESCLGGVKIEGVVVKNYNLFTAEYKIALAKLVADSFKEVAGSEWRKANPTRADIVEELITTYRTEARWRKAVQHLIELGVAVGEPRDIGALVKEVCDDVEKEETDEIKDVLYRHFWPQIRRGLTKGLPEWYKAKLAEEQLGG